VIGIPNDGHVPVIHVRDLFILEVKARFLAMRAIRA